jgi:hypothetical protein
LLLQVAAGVEVVKVLTRQVQVAAVRVDFVAQ